MQGHTSERPVSASQLRQRHECSAHSGCPCSHAPTPMLQQGPQSSCNGSSHSSPSPATCSVVSSWPPDCAPLPRCCFHPLKPSFGSPLNAACQKDLHWHRHGHRLGPGPRHEARSPLSAGPCPSWSSCQTASSYTLGQSSAPHRAKSTFILFTDLTLQPYSVVKMRHWLIHSVSSQESTGPAQRSKLMGSQRPVQLWVPPHSSVCGPERAGNGLLAQRWRRESNTDTILHNHPRS